MKKIASLMLVALPLLFVLIGYTAAQGPTPRPDFSISADRDTIVTEPGAPANFKLYVSPLNGFRGVVEMTCTTSDPHVRCQVPGAIKIGADLVVPFSVTAIAAAGPGAYPIVVTGKGTSSNLGAGPVTHTQTLHLAVVPRGVGINP